MNEADVNVSFGGAGNPLSVENASDAIKGARHSSSDGLRSAAQYERDIKAFKKTGRKTDYEIEFYFSDDDEHAIDATNPAAFNSDRKSDEAFANRMDPSKKNSKYWNKDGTARHVSMADIARWNLTEGHPQNGPAKWGHVVMDFAAKQFDTQVNELIEEIMDVAEEGVNPSGRSLSTNIQTASGGKLSRSMYEAFFRFGWRMKGVMRDCIMSAAPPDIADSTKKWRKWKGLDPEAPPLNVTGAFANSLRFSINGKEIKQFGK